MRTPRQRNKARYRTRSLAKYCGDFQNTGNRYTAGRVCALFSLPALSKWSPQNCVQRLTNISRLCINIFSMVATNRIFKALTTQTHRSYSFATGTLFNKWLIFFVVGL
jgi:hypothetical protein